MRQEAEENVRQRALQAAARAGFYVPVGVKRTSGSLEESRMRSAGKYWSLSTLTTSPTLTC